MNTELLEILKKESNRKTYVEKHPHPEKSDDDIIMTFLENSLMCEAYNQGYDDGYIEAMRRILNKMENSRE